MRRSRVGKSGRSISERKSSFDGGRTLDNLKGSNGDMLMRDDNSNANIINNNNINNINNGNDEEEYDANADIDMQPIEVKRIPDDQIATLLDEHKNEVFTKVITATDPNVSKAITRFNYQDMCFKVSPSITHLAVHFEMDGLLIHVDSDEARDQQEWLADVKQVEKRHIGTDMDDAIMSNTKDMGGDDDDDQDQQISTPTDDRALKNQFNFSERATQTFNNPMREREVATEPPPTCDFSANVTHWEIFDTYLEDIDKTQQSKKEKEKPGRAAAAATTAGAGGGGGGAKFANEEDSAGSSSNKSTSSTSGDVKADVPASALTSLSSTAITNSPTPLSPSSISSSLSSSSPPSLSSSSLSSLSSPLTTSSVISSILKSDTLALALKTMERMVNQNAEASFFSDYAYYEDKNELKRSDTLDKRGSFLPLWKFVHDKARRKSVTGIAWNPEFTDLFAVSFGSYDFMKQGSGLICCYSLKNTQYPEYQFATESGVMCLDWHPQHTALLVCGLYDGTVAVYDVRSKSHEAIYISNDPKVKHTDPVWQVRWQRDDITSNKNLNFFSIATDGRVTNWIMNKNELINEEVVELKLVNPPPSSLSSEEKNHLDDTRGGGGGGVSSFATSSETAEKSSSSAEDEAEKAATASSSSSAAAAASSVVSNESSVVGLAGGCCFDFNPSYEHLFVVGTEEGSIQSYSKAYNSQFLKSFSGHHMSVYSVKWNPFHPLVFLSCSADWSVKLWEANTSRPVMTFDLNSSVADIAWAPYSSTVFSVVTADGKVRLYDLSVNKHEPIGETRVTKKAKFTHIAFNPSEPILCVGDDRGQVSILKLSANLRRTSAPTLKELDVDEEIDKLDKLLIITEKDPPSLLTANFLSNMPKHKPKSKDGATAIANKKNKSTPSDATASRITSPRSPPVTHRSQH